MKDNVRPRPDQPSQPRRIIPVALEGARTNLGGVVTAASTDIKIYGVPVARIGDTVSHPELGDALITTGLDAVRWKGYGVACAGSLTTRDDEYIVDPGQAHIVGIEYDDGHVEIRAVDDAKLEKDPPATRPDGKDGT